MLIQMKKGAIVAKVIYQYHWPVSICQKIVLKKKEITVK